MLLDALDAKARAALTRARSRPLSFVVRYLSTPGADRVLVILGEAHLKLGEASEIGKAVVDAFPLRGVETFPVKKVGARSGSSSTCPGSCFARRRWASSRTARSSMQRR
jgi:hypothetical protein